MTTIREKIKEALFRNNIPVYDDLIADLEALFNENKNKCLEHGKDGIVMCDRCREISMPKVERLSREKVIEAVCIPLIKWNIPEADKGRIIDAICALVIPEPDENKIRIVPFQHRICMNINCGHCLDCARCQGKERPGE